ADRRAVAEASEAVRPSATRSDRAVARQRVPPGPHDRAGGDTSTVEEAPTPVNRQGVRLRGRLASFARRRNTIAAKSPPTTTTSTQTIRTGGQLESWPW